jgi:hypothetical protein
VTVDGRDVFGLGCGWDVVDDMLAGLAERYAKVWSADYASDLDRLRGDVVALLSDLRLVEVTGHALIVHPSAARYRPDPQHGPAKSRARTRPNADTSDHGPGWAALFDAETS